MIKAVIFDLDNTLVDFMRMKKQSCEAAISSMIDAGLVMGKDKALKILFELYDQHGIEDHYIFQRFLKKTIGKIDWKILSNGIVAYRKVKAGYLETYPHTVATLLKLKERGIQLAILSDAPRDRAWIRLAALKLTDYFEVVVTHDDTGKLKPSKRPFELVLSRLKLNPDETIMVGDWPARDIRGAKNMGIKTIYAKYGSLFDGEHADADYEINDIMKILDIVEKENGRAGKKQD